MPYVNCPQCGTPTFALVAWSTVRSCQSCGARLAPPGQNAPGDGGPAPPSPGDGAEPQAARLAPRSDGALIEGYLSQLRHGAGWIAAE